MADSFYRKPRRVNSVWTCLDCDADITPTRYPTHVPRPRLRCYPCGQQRYLFTDILSGRQVAGGIVSRAKNQGLLRPASDFACVDCGKQARDYDHRDYSRPLDVQPVCRSCNQRRGHAIPLDQRIVLSLVYAAMNGVA